MASSPVAEGTRAAGAMVPVPYRVARRRRETHDSWTLELEPHGEAAVAPLAPGQFAMLYAFGKGEVPISVSALPLVHTIRAVGVVSAALCEARRGDVLGVRGPFGTAWPVGAAEGADVVVLCGGIGLAPLRPVVHHLLAHRERYGNVAVLYGGRSPEELLYTAEIERWRGRFDVQVEVAVDQADAGWRGRVGVVTTLVPKVDFDPSHTVAMICGPEVMMRFAVVALQDRGVPAEAIHVSLERSMKCAIGLCGHCQLGPAFVCKDGPVFRWDAVEALLRVREL
jgi:NAD(P)H-flavin reductase